MNQLFTNYILSDILKTISLLNDKSPFQLFPLHPERDLPTIFNWVNAPYAIPYWGMNGSFQQLQDAYNTMQASPGTQSMVGYLNKTLICQLDLYDPFTDPIQACYRVSEGDLGIHLLMAPGKKPVKDFTAKILYLISNILFSNAHVQRIVGEPDQHNEAANLLLHKLFFEFQHRITLSYKTANLYTMTRAQFLQLPPASFSF